MPAHYLDLPHRIDEKLRVWTKVKKDAIASPFFLALRISRRNKNLSYLPYLRDSVEKHTTKMSGANSWLARQRKSDLVELAQTVGLKEYVLTFFLLFVS